MSGRGHLGNVGQGWISGGPDEGGAGANPNRTKQAREMPKYAVLHGNSSF